MDMDWHILTMIPLVGLTAGWRGVRIGGKTLGMGGGLGSSNSPLVQAFDKAKAEGDRAAMERIARQMNEARLKQNEAKAAVKAGMSDDATRGGGVRKKPGSVDLIQPLDIKINAPKTGAVKEWKNNPGDDMAGLNAAHWYARKEKTDAFMFEGNSFMSRVLHVTTSPEMFSRLARSSTKQGKDENTGQRWAPVIKVTPSGDVSQVRVYID